jgi:hypothetical protein
MQEERSELLSESILRIDEAWTASQRARDLVTLERRDETTTDFSRKVGDHLLVRTAHSLDSSRLRVIQKLKLRWESEGLAGAGVNVLLMHPDPVTHLDRKSPEPRVIEQ